jgi:hypothetical protein
MLIRKFCACGVKLERDVANEESAREVIHRFRLEHSGRGHGPISGGQWLKLIQQIINRKAKSKPRALNTSKPLLGFLRETESNK